MENGTIAEYPLANFQFLSVCHYITGFAFFLYNRHCIKLNEKNHTVLVLNGLFEYFNNSKNETEAQRELLRKILKGTDLYGGRKKEKLDRRYVRETYQYIISNALFFQYGNINGYLAGIINRADNINYSALKEYVLQDLSQNYTTRDYCTPGNKSFKLTNLTSKTIFEKFVLSIFPEPNQDLSIMNVNYIYAMGGLKIINTTTDISNLTFNDCVQLGHEIDSQVFDNKTYRLVLEMFSVPALFFSAYKDKNTFIENYRLSRTEAFWTQSYKKLFSYINSEMQNLVKQDFKKNLHYKLQQEIGNLQDRTFIAYSILKVYCRYGDYNEVSEFYVGVYKTMYHWITKLILPDRCQTDDLPVLEDVFNEQFSEVEKTYNEIEQNTIRKVLTDGEILERINSNVTVQYARIEDYPFDGFNPPNSHKMNQDIYLLFVIVENKKPDFYALRQEKNTLTLLKNSGNKPEFSKAVAGDPTLQMEIAIFAQWLKHRNENSSAFVERVANKKTKQFMENLIQHYRDPTTGENILNIVKLFVPFYSCVESIQADDKLVAAISCTLDVLSFIPFAGFAAKYTRIFTNSLTREVLQNTLLTSVLSRVRNVGMISLRVLLAEILQVASRTISNEIFIKGLLTDLVFASLRTVDPGCESLYQISRFSIRALEKIFSALCTSMRKTPWTHNLIKLLESILKSRAGRNLLADHTGLVPFFLRRGNNFQIVRYFYPGGSHIFGPTCVSSFGKTGELRSVEGYPLEFSMVPVKSGDKGFYKPYDPTTGKLGDVKFEMGKGDILRKVDYLLDLVAPQYGLKFFRNYHVYPMTISWGEKPPRTDADDKIPRSDDSNGLEISQSSSGQSLSQFDNPGNSGIIRSDSGISRSASDQSLSQFDNPSDSGISRSDSGISRSASGQSWSQFDNPSDAGIIRAEELSPEVSGSSKGAIRKIPVVPGTSEDAARKFMTQKDLSVPDRHAPGVSQHFLKQEDYIAEFGRIEYDDCVSLLKKFIDDGLSSIRQNNQQFRKLQLALDRITFMQMEEALIKKPINLFCTTLIKRRKLIKYTKNLQGKEYSFNDLIPLTKAPPNIPANNEENLFTITTIVIYQLNIDNQYGLVDLTNFHEMFRNQYILYPEVSFTVNNVRPSKNLLILELDKNPLSLDEWTKIRNDDLKLLMVNDFDKSKRIQSIEKAAESVSQHVPKWKFTKSKKVFKSYILKTEPSTSPVPTYDKLAHDIYNNLRFPDNYYQEWKITNGKYIDDVLFDNKLYAINDLFSARGRIHKIFGPIVGEKVEPVFAIYHKSAAIRNSLRFVDFFVIHSYLRGALNLNKDNNRRILVSLYRLALRQCSEDWIKEPITIFSSKMYSTDLYDQLKNYKPKNTISFGSLGIFGSKQDLVVDKLKEYSKRKLIEKPVLFQVTIRNQAGIPDYGRLVSIPSGLHFVFPTMRLVVDAVNEEIINGIKVLVVKSHDSENPIENRMVYMVRELGKFFSTSTVFY